MILTTPLQAELAFQAFKTLNLDPIIWRSVPFFAQSATKCAQKRRKACIDSWLKFAYLRIPVFYCIGSYKKFMRSYGIFARRQAPFQQPVAQKADEPSSLLNKATLHGGTK